MVDRFSIPMRMLPVGCGVSLDRKPTYWAGNIENVGMSTIKQWERGLDCDYVCGQTGFSYYGSTTNLWKHRPYCLGCAREQGWEW